jgi:predicted ATP-grasp superfamily ATP-dependent carboligase
MVLDAVQRSALAVTRSLGKHGVPVVTADETGSALAGRSRFSAGYFQYPSPRLQSTEFISRLAALVRSEDIQIILPMTELTTQLLLQNKSLFDGVSLPFPDIETVNNLADKCSLMHLAGSLGIPIPETRHVSIESALDDWTDSTGYPVVLKPCMSWIYHNCNWQRTSVRFAGCHSEVESIVSSDPAFTNRSYLVQECVEGKGQGIFAMYDRGKGIAFFSHRRLREKPPRGGVSVLSESIPVNPVLLSYARRLLDHAAWHGIAMVEFKVTDNGTPYLMEVNTRFWGSLQLAIDAGVDFPWLLYQLACDTRPDAVAEFRSGIRLRWLLGDIDSLYLTLRDKQYSFIYKVKALLRFLIPSPFKTRHEVNRPGDLAPFWWELGKYVRDLTR